MGLIKLVKNLLGPKEETPARGERERKEETLNLSGQQIERDKLRPAVEKIIWLMEQRKAMWQKLTLEERKKWLASNRDPFLKMCYEWFVYAKEEFFEQKYGVQE